MKIFILIKEDFKKVQTDEKSLKKFGIVVGAIFVAIALFSARDAIWIGWIGVLLVAFGALYPRALYYPYLAWMMFAVVMGFFATRILLVLVYYFGILPIGLLKRVFGGNPFSLPFEKNKKTYWARPEKGIISKEDLEHLY